MKVKVVRKCFLLNIQYLNIPCQAVAKNNGIDNDMHDSVIETQGGNMVEIFQKSAR